MIRLDAHLFDVGVAVDLVNNDIPDRVILGVYGDPTPPVGRVVREFLERRWLIVGDGVQANGAELFAGQPLNGLQSGAVLSVSCADRDHPQSIAG